MDTDLILLHLSLIKGIGPATVLNILEKKSSDVDLNDLYRLKKSDFVALFDLSATLAGYIVDGLSDKSLFEKELGLIQKYQISWMSCHNKIYPQLLKHIHMPPLVLYWKGKALFDTDKILAIIGSRSANSYGEQVIRALVPALVARGWVIVSGGALGADSMAHRITLDAGGKTIVVLGSGLLCPYPLSNNRLFDAIIAAEGTVLSSFSLTSQAMPGNFPARNRIISGLSRGCLVVQAAQKSGAHITAQYALQQGREVFAIPGTIDDELSAGCHTLIQQGAKLVRNVDDILEEFGEKSDLMGYKQNIEKDRSKHQAIGRYVHIQEKTEHNAPQHIIMSFCTRPVSIDELMIQTGLKLSELQTLLFELQLKGRIRQNSLGMWHKI